MHLSIYSLFRLFLTGFLLGCVDFVRQLQVLGVQPLLREVSYGIVNVLFFVFALSILVLRLVSVQSLQHLSKFLYFVLVCVIF